MGLLSKFQRNKVSPGGGPRKPKRSAMEKQLMEAGGQLTQYIFFIVVFTLLVMQSNIEQSYRFSSKIKELFLGSEMSADYTKVFAKLYQDVLTEDDFWEWLETPWAAIMYEEKSNPADAGFILGHNRLVGAFQLEAKRGHEDKDCAVPTVYENVLEHCYTGGHGDFLTTDTIILAQNLNLTQAVDRIRTLRNESWLTPNTREVTVSFTVYNANVELWCAAELSFKFYKEGGIRPKPTFYTVSFFRHLMLLQPAFVNDMGFRPKPSDYIFFCLEIVFSITVALYFFTEIKEMVDLKLDYFRNVWNLMDCLNLCIFVGVLITRVQSIFMITDLNFAPEPDEFVDFAESGLWIWMISQMTSFNLILTWFKVFKYTQLSPKLSQLTSTMAKSAKELSIFLVMVTIIFLAFAQAFYMSFGMDMFKYHALIESSLTLCEMMLGEFDLEALIVANSLLGPVLFVGYCIINFFIVLNMLFAIINDSYSKVKDDIDKAEDPFLSFFQKAVEQQADLMKQSMMRMSRRASGLPLGLPENKNQNKADGAQSGISSMHEEKKQLTIEEKAEEMKRMIMTLASDMGTLTAEVEAIKGVYTPRGPSTLAAPPQPTLPAGPPPQPPATTSPRGLPPVPPAAPPPESPAGPDYSES